MDFVAIDVETANADMASICQIGLASYEGGVLAEEWKSYIDPEDFFDAVNVSIHGIDEQTVAGKPRLPEIAGAVVSRLHGQVVVCHTHFDRVAVHQAFGKYELTHPHCVWLDSARVTRRTWSQFASRGYGLHSVCSLIGYDFPRHDALEDAKAAAHILLAAIEATGLSVDDWLLRVERPINLTSTDGKSSPEGALFGEVMVFTGALQIPRREAADLAHSVGCEVADGVNKRTTVLVVGDQDAKRLAGHTKSSKHRKAEKLIAQGQAIHILRESDFERLVALAREGVDPNQRIEQTGGCAARN